MRKKSYFSIFIFFFLSLKTFSNNGFSLELHQGYLFGTGYEIVYRDQQGNKLSELIWDLEGVKLIGVSSSYRSSEGFTFRGSFYLNYNNPVVNMEDYDWKDYNRSDWTDWSKSPTDINTVFRGDLNGEFRLLQGERLTFYVMLGYKFDMYSWVAIGGEYIYSSSGGFRDIIGTLPEGEKAISYDQYFYYPYLGLITKVEGRNYSLDAKLIYSNKVSAKDEDIHHLRDLYFEGFFEDGKMIELGLKGEYNITSRLSLNTLYNYTNYMLNKGYTKMTNLETGQETVYWDGSVGIKNYTHMYSVGLRYTF